MLDTYRSALQKQGYRMTPQRTAILRILSESKCHLTPLDVYESASQSMPGITEATIYRTLSFLTSQGLLLAAHIGNGQLAYEIAHHDHHHLICRSCGAASEVSHDLLKPLYSRLGEQTGFKVDRMHVTFFGLCPDCLSTQPGLHPALD
jgi:Fe2+ or Zn2+ uptake regulation protein